jgi:peptidoglycan/xylan/chitin deacetylase (PgdA/CDA1 family)
MWGSVSTRLARAVGRVVRSRPAEIRWPGGVVSFTFDDFPKSALLAGGGLLEQYGSRGTYYAALALAGGGGEMGPMFDREDLRAAHARGHEFACHTYSHLDCSRARTPAIVADIDDNAAAFAALLDGYAPENFAFPFGALSLGAKRALAGRFASCRGIEWGLNSGTVDLAHLASTRLYHHDFDRDALRRLIDRNRTLGGWLIFYTHDVAAAPSRYGCTPDQLEAMIAYAAERCEVLPVRDVVPRLTPRT